MLQSNIVFTLSLTIINRRVLVGLKFAQIIWDFGICFVFIFCIESKPIKWLDLSLFNRSDIAMFPLSLSWA